jgi:hypothetical protein
MVAMQDVFGAAHLQPCGPAPWGDPIPENGPGVYVVALADREEIVYIGRTKRSLRKRLKEFYRHKYGARSPHRGGQAVLALKCGLLIYWAATSDCAAAEHAMIEHVKMRVGSLPFANRVRSARAS